MSADERAERAFFGRRKGHPLREHQASLLDEFLPALALDLAQPAPALLRGLFRHTEVDVAPPLRVNLEIGFGGAEHLLAQAERDPSSGFIGCEPFVNGMAKALAGIKARGLTNIRLHFGDAIDMLRWFPAGSLSRIDLLYPDPWPKRRHWKRRFVQPERLALMADRLCEGGLFRFASDSEDYVAWTLEHALREPALEWTAQRAEDWRESWPGYVPTRYEAKARREGRSSAYLVFRRVNAARETS